MIYTKTFRITLMAVICCIAEHATADFWSKLGDTATKAAEKSIAQSTSDLVGGAAQSAGRITKAVGGLAERKALGAIEGFGAVSAQVKQQIEDNVKTFGTTSAGPGAQFSAGPGAQFFANKIAEFKWEQAEAANPNSSSRAKWWYMEGIASPSQMLENARNLSENPRTPNIMQIQSGAAYIAEMVRQLIDANISSERYNLLFFSDALAREKIASEGSNDILEYVIEALQAIWGVKSKWFSSWR